MTHDELIAAVESFDGTDEEARKLSDQVLLAMGWQQDFEAGYYHWISPTGYAPPYNPHPLRNAQDALDLLPVGWLVGVSETWKTDNRPQWICVLTWKDVANPKDIICGEAHTIQAAITAAALRAGG